MHNLADGGFLLLLTDCHTTGCISQRQRHNITRVESDGQTSSWMSFEKLDCDLIENVADARLFEKSPGQYCASFVCYKRDYLILREDIGHFNLTNICFEDKDFVGSD